MSEKSVLHVISWDYALEHYKSRMRVHRQLRTLHGDGQSTQFAKLLLGISNDQGNYSARDHDLGPLILSQNPDAERRLFDVAEKLQAVSNAHDVPGIIRNAGLKFFRIGVGSEASCMLNPRICWIANTRSIWTHLVFKHGGNFGRANEELKLYRDEDETSEMAYRKWAAIHGAMNGSLTEIVEQGNLLAKKASVEPGKVKYLWADAIANALYAYHINNSARSINPAKPTRNKLSLAQAFFGQFIDRPFGQSTQKNPSKSTRNKITQPAIPTILQNFPHQ